MRLDKLLAGQGCGSRREIRQMLAHGRVLLNGLPAGFADCKVNTASDKVLLDGREIRFKEHVYIMMNKPRGVISASSDPREPTVVDLLPPELRRPGLFPAGRLDRDTEGMMIITDDGEFAHQILSPKKHVPKRYFAQVTGSMTERGRALFESGLELEDGTVCKPAKLEIIDEQNGLTRAEVTISEGKYHQIKRMFEQLGGEVVALKRLSMGGLQLDPALAPGAAREMTGAEVEIVRNTSIRTTAKR